jgi:predicted neutral ceramidase superfamily lipid hydrolase
MKSIDLTVTEKLFKDFCKLNEIRFVGFALLIPFLSIILAIIACMLFMDNLVPLLIAMFVVIIAFPILFVSYAKRKYMTKWANKTVLSLNAEVRLEIYDREIRLISLSSPLKPSLIIPFEKIRIVGYRYNYFIIRSGFTSYPIEINNIEFEKYMLSVMPKIRFEEKRSFI